MVGFGWCWDCCGCVGAGCLLVMVVVLLCNCVGFVLRACVCRGVFDGWLLDCCWLLWFDLLIV